MAIVKLIKPGDIRIYRDEPRPRARQRAVALAQMFNTDWGEKYPEMFVVDASDYCDPRDVLKDHRRIRR